ncbi:MAG: hypothetical protein M3Y80_04095 [Verrucomicrobiota bacterium]|nr:hypothetical protein [Verrucomicrobiota bacterium]
MKPIRQFLASLKSRWSARRRPTAAGAQELHQFAPLAPKRLRTGSSLREFHSRHEEE